MAAVAAPVELPTGRRSYYNISTPIDIHDPNWIPVLDGSSYKPQLSPTEKEVFTPQLPATFSLFPSPSSSPKPRPAFSHNYTKSSLAPESVTSETDSRSQSPQDSIEPLPSIPSSFQSSYNATKGHNRQATSTTTGSNEEKMSVSIETQGDSAPSTEDPENVSVLDDRASSRQSQPMEQIVESMVAPSIRSSMTSMKKSTVPTSKYNRKPVASITERPSLVPSLPQTPQESPRLGPSIPAPSTTAVPTQPLTSPKLPPFELPQYPDRSASLQANLQSAKSTASERRQRALHSHPSNVSLRSQRNSSSDDAEIVPKPPSVRSKPRKSTDSRATTPRSTIYESPTPAPTAPLPQLPPEAHMQSRRPSTTRDNRPQQSTLPLPMEEIMPPPISSFRPYDHSRVASFMTEKNTVVLRRFDDVHARLLLSLQDEISQLEQELVNLESPTSSGSASEKILAKTRILRELRKVVAEYGKLSPMYQHQIQ